MTERLYKKIMVATDGSEQTKKAVEHSIELAKLNEAKLHGKSGIKRFLLGSVVEKVVRTSPISVMVVRGSI